MNPRLVVAALLLATLAACGGASDPPSTQPTFGGGSATTADPSTLSAAKADAGIEDCPSSAAPAPTTKALPSLTLDCLGGGAPVRLSGLGGVPTVINLWASWCEPCRDELPHFARAHQAYGDRVRILGIDFKDTAPEAAIELARRSGVTYPLLVDRQATTKVPFRVIGLPQTVFVDAQGRMVATERTAFRSYADLAAAIDEHLGVSP